jgi:hypothetical protein
MTALPRASRKLLLCCTLIQICIQANAEMSLEFQVATASFLNSPELNAVGCKGQQLVFPNYGIRHQFTKSNRLRLSREMTAVSYESRMKNTHRQNTGKVKVLPV